MTPAERSRRIDVLFARSGNQSRRPFTRAQTIIIALGFSIFIAVETVEYMFFKIDREAIEAAAILRVCPPLRMPAQLALNEGEER